MKSRAQRRFGVAGRSLGRLQRAWTSPAAASWAGGLAVAGCGALFLESAATVQVVYTVRPSYALLLGALLAGAPLAWRGWRNVPIWIRWAACGLVLAYLAAAALGDQAVLASSGRGGSHRDVVYLTDLLVGLGVVGLVIGLWRLGQVSGAMFRALALGAAAAAVYGLYQWFAQQLGWPLSDVNNTLDSNGVTSEGLQGTGLFGWERIRGTFLEPHFLAAYLASLLPLTLLFVGGGQGRRRLLAGFGAAVVLCALVLTASVPSWVIVVVVAEATLVLLATARGWILRSAAAAALLAATCLAVPLLNSSPELLASATGRTDSEIVHTTEFRTRTWERAKEVWSRRPVLGYGPGQSSVRLAQEFGEPVLVSAQGLWAASLIDGGVLAFGMWMLFLGGVLVTGALALHRAPTRLRCATFAAAAAAVLGSEIAGDRLGLAPWVLIGLLLAAAIGEPAGADSDRGKQEADRAAA